MPIECSNRKSVNGFDVSIAGEIPPVVNQMLLLCKCISACVWYVLGVVVGALIYSLPVILAP